MGRREDPPGTSAKKVTDPKAAKDPKEKAQTKSPRKKVQDKAGEKSNPNPTVGVTVDPQTGLPVVATVETPEINRETGRNREQLEERDNPVEDDEVSTGHNNLQERDRDEENDPQAGPTNQEIWNKMKAMMEQMAVLTKALPKASDAEEPEKEPEVVVLEQPVKTPKKVSYLVVLEHMVKLKTGNFTGGSDPVKADEWKSRLVRNFRSTRCPVDYRKDIAAHFLEGDAANWWESVDKRMGDRIHTYEDFESQFNKKFFPPEAWDRLNSAYLELRQGRQTVREYEEEFNRLRRYVGSEQEEESKQVRRFMRGLRVDVRNHCLAQKFGTVTELVERAALIEEGIEEEDKLKSSKFVSRSDQGGSSDRKRKRDGVEDSSRSSGRHPECKSCGRRHAGECWKASGACLCCGNKDHEARNCPRPERGQNRRSGENPGVCYYCGKAGHIRPNCPKLQVEMQATQARSKDNRGVHEPAAKRQNVTPRVYELSKDAGDSGRYNSITGT